MRLRLEALWQRFGVLAVISGCADPRGSLLVRRSVGADARTVVEPEPHRLRADPLVWGGEQRLEAGDAAELDEFGWSVSLAADRALVGARGNDFFTGAAYTFVKRGGDWIEEQKLVASGAVEGDNFGWSVSLAGDRALIGAYGVDSFAGAAYVFVRSGDGWLEQQKLVASDRAELDQLGWSVSLAGDRALLGAYGKQGSKGAAYVFVKNGDSWLEEQKLEASDGVAEDDFGWSVSLGEERALVGAPGQGRAHLFVRDGSTWSEEQVLVASDSVDSDQFGNAVSLAGDRVLIGANWDDDLRGAAYVFVHDGSSWVEEQKLVASDGAVPDRFGNSTSLGVDRALVGAFGYAAGRGAAYVFVRNGSSWVEEQKLVASDGDETDLFALSVSLDADHALVGANYTDLQRGSAYVFSLGLANGNPCLMDVDCASRRCVDDRCCDVDCSGPCAACSIEEGALADGTCTIFPAGFAGKPACGTLACDGQSPECVGCQADDDCPESRYCALDRTCRPRKPQGEACDDREDCLNSGCRFCQSDFCVDGVCCDAVCDGSCEACSAELTGGDSGRCAPIAAGTDPDGECTDDGIASCEANGRCDGAGECQKYQNRAACEPEPCTRGDECTSGHCEDGICCDRGCAASERCLEALKVTGGDGSCGPARAAVLGASCAFDVQCTSGHCEHGTCCESACSEGRCTSNGECASASVAPRDDPGCACRVSGSRAPAPRAWAGAALGLLLFYRRRRARSRAAQSGSQVSGSECPQGGSSPIPNEVCP